MSHSVRALQCAGHVTSSMCNCCRRVFKETGRLLIAFIIGAFATVVGTIAAFKLVPLAALGAQDSWKIASALAARHIGGAINYVAVAETLQVSPSAQMAGLAADNLLCAPYRAQYACMHAVNKSMPH